MQSFSIFKPLFLGIKSRNKIEIILNRYLFSFTSNSIFRKDLSRS